MSAAANPNPDLERLRYPTGRFTPPARIGPAERAHWMEDVEIAPANLRAAVLDLTPQQLDTPYREGGWTVRQVAHHLVDSHMNAYIRYRLALTEDAPTVMVYSEKRWAELPDARTAPVEISLRLLEGIHARWLILLRALQPADFARTFRHPERGEMTLDWNLGLYAWHGRHHTAQILALRESRDW